MPIDAFIFGGRRSTTVPLVTEARNWVEGVYMAATMSRRRLPRRSASRASCVAIRSRCCRSAAITSAIISRTGSLGKQLEGAGAKLPKIYCVNWFRKDANGKFVWPGFGENMRVLKWMLDRLEGTGGGGEHAFGVSPAYEDLHWDGLDFTRDQFDAVTSMNADEWREELKLHAALFDMLKLRLPAEMTDTMKKIEQRIGADGSHSRSHPDVPPPACIAGGGTFCIGSTHVPFAYCARQCATTSSTARCTSPRR